jgi:hypothetical protein
VLVCKDAVAGVLLILEAVHVDGRDVFEDLGPQEDLGLLAPPALVRLSPVPLGSVRFQG